MLSLLVEFGMEVILFLIFALIIWCSFQHELSYYMIHLVYWPGICHVASGPGGHIMGYGKFNSHLLICVISNSYEY